MTSIPGATFGQKFNNVNVIQLNYKTVGSHNIRADVIIPKSLPAGPRPVITRVHGGGLTGGDSMFSPMFSAWLPELAETHGAIIISPNYRLMPEATGVQILEDMDDFWTWLHSDTLRDILASHNVELDLDRVITAGESAGGLLSLYLTFTYPDQIRAATTAYPLLSWDEPAILLDHPNPTAPESFIDEYIAKMQPGEYVSADIDYQRGHLSSVIHQHKRGPALYTRDSENTAYADTMFQLPRLDHPDVKLPPGGLLIIHGVEDRAVLVEASHRFVDKARKALKSKQGGDKISLCLRPGAHGFDVNSSLKEQWLTDALAPVLKDWLE
ncbi:hypothetical protein N7456_000899 [Penicillium angulare]|uniref:Alpha/beta hydrolase fold-3 domain-containing protein n=1 Tax=Penicillium angulare TaxID=116970 RepID=A0A9W9KSR6_9EURO|nr:hypothetical protein N7456_000899 [Penicillium angulare]